MSIPGFGNSGGNLNNNFQPTPRDIETSAWTEVNKSKLGIVSGNDPLDQQILTKVNDDTSKYSSTSSRPFLPSPLERIRQSAPELSNQNENWEPFYNNLLDNLPPGIQVAIQKEYQKKGEDRLTSIQNLNDLLIGTAKTLLKIQNGAHSSPENLAEDTSFIERTLNNQAMSSLAKLGAAQDVSDISQEITPFLQTNQTLHSVAKDQFVSVLQSMKDVGMGLKATSKEEFENVNLADKAWLPHFVGSIQNQLSANFSETPGYHLLKTSLDTLTAVSTGVGLETTPFTPTLYLSAFVANKGLHDGESPYFGSELQQLSNKLADGSAAMIHIPSLKTASTNLFGTLYTTTLSLGLGIHSVLTSQQEVSPFHSMLTQSFIANSGILHQTFEQVALALGAHQANAKTIGHLFSLGMTLLSIHSTDQPQTIESLTLALKQPLEKDLSALSQVISDIDHPLSMPLNAFMQQGLVALEHEDLAHFQKSLSDTLILLGLNERGIKENLQTLKESASNTSQILLQNDDQYTIKTQISMSA